MTAGNNGTSTPEDDDPFGYLYEDGRAAGAVPPPGGGGYGYPGPTSGGQPGVPRTSYNHVRTVGERQYGQQAPQQQYGQQPQYAQQQAYGQPTAQYAAPETYPGGPPVQQPPRQPGNGGNGGPNHKGLLIGAVAVVAVVVIGIGVALATSGGDSSKDKNAGSDNAGGGQTSAETTKPSHAASTPPKADLPKQDAATLQLGGAATTATDVPGAKGSGGSYVVLNQPGDSATWTVKAPSAGSYRLSINYGVPGKDAKTSLTVNDAAKPTVINMKNYANAPDGDASKGWTNTWNLVNLKKGPNTIKISCETGDQCGVNLDQVILQTQDGKSS
ncbi:carbohydrate-binding protein [Streptomyces sp. NBC_01306]|uniref:carbohydrate-binding protein n=1 Tax=Streptomyces sp. NBC_01306 TaxID=2903819 RepID=UPI0022518CCC|nr:carbohydrate-binding protein [Streptomyces sp. NBC_01306]MCX4725660.1 carbohydrate-binding protein [Streptomyces sp. NBC_01306]